MPVKRKKKTATPLFAFTPDDEGALCEGMDDFLHLAYKDPEPTTDELSVCIICNHPLSITEERFRYSDGALSVHAQCACWGCWSFGPTVESVMGLVKKYKSRACTECKRDTPNLTCIVCEKGRSGLWRVLDLSV